VSAAPVAAMSTPPVRALLWDMDGTLVDSEPLHARALAGALDSRGLTTPPDLEDRTLGLSARDVYDVLRAETALDLPFDDWIRIKYRVYHRLVAGLRPFGAALACYRRMEAAGTRQAIVSNSDRIIVTANLDAVELTRPGLVSVAFNDVRAGKPAPEPYLRAAWLLDVPPEACIVLEDSATGARAGLAAGMRTCLVPHAAGRARDAAPDGAIRLESFEALTPG